MPIPDIALVPKRRQDLQSGEPDYHVYAGEQLVGRIYQSHDRGWNWSITSVMFDSSVDWPMKGHVTSFDEAKRCMRKASDVWLPWALAIKPDDLKYPRVNQDLRKMGAR